MDVNYWVPLPPQSEYWKGGCSPDSSALVYFIFSQESPLTVGDDVGCEVCKLVVKFGEAQVLSNKTEVGISIVP